MSQHNASFSSVLQQLANDHFNRSISLAEYRAKRREILDQIDQYYNGAAPIDRSAHPKSDTTTIPNPTTNPMPNQSTLGTTMTFNVNDILGPNGNNDNSTE